MSTPALARRPAPGRLHPPEGIHRFHPPLRFADRRGDEIQTSKSPPLAPSPPIPRPPLWRASLEIESSCEISVGQDNPLCFTKRKASKDFSKLCAVGAVYDRSHFIDSRKDGRS